MSQINYALRFGGNTGGQNSYVKVPYKALFNFQNTAHTVEVRVKMLSRGLAGKQAHLVGRRSGNVADFCYGIGSTHPSTHYNAYTMSSLFNTGSMQYLSNNFIPFQEWKMLSYVYVPGSISYYLDGVLMGSASETHTINVAHDLIFGGNDYPFDGLIDEVRIWNKALPALDIALQHNLNLQGNEAGLIGLWKFNEGQGSVVKDLTSNGNDGQAFNCTWEPSDLFAPQVVAITNPNAAMTKGTDFQFPFTVQPPTESLKTYFVNANEMGTVGTSKLLAYPISKSDIDYLKKLEVL